jgi:hypothetical protein
MLVEFVLEQEPSAVELEATCRKLINGDGAKPFPPQITEIIAKLKAEKESWEPRKWAIGNVDCAYHELIEAIPKARAAAEKRKAEAEAEAARQKAESEAAAARRKAEAEARKKAEEELAARRKADDIECLLDDAYELGRNCPLAQYGLIHSFGAAHEMFVTSPDMRVREYDMGEECYVAFALGVFEQRREDRAWEYVIEADAPTLPPMHQPSSKRRRRNEVKPGKLAAARKRTPMKKSKPTMEVDK